MTAANLDDIVRSRRQAVTDGVRQTFTIADEAALATLRKAQGGSTSSFAGMWQWTLWLVRAANLLSPAPVAFARVEHGSASTRVEFEFELPHAWFRPLDPRTFLAAALSVDPPWDFSGHRDEVRAWARIERRLATAINLALMLEPSRIELRTPASGLVWSRQRTEVAGDAYRTIDDGERAPEERARICLELAPRGLFARVGAWFSSDDWVQEWSRAWRAALPAADERRDLNVGLPLAWPARRESVLLGRVGTLTRAPVEDIVLVREGVRVLALKRALEQAGLNLGGIAMRQLGIEGFVECESLRLTADERDVVRDVHFETLLAWLQDVVAHTFVDAEGGPRTLWPTTLTGVSTVSGRTLDLEALSHTIAAGNEIAYVWRHRADRVPTGVRARVLALWPSEFVLVHAAFPHARFVDASALGAKAPAIESDLRALAEGSLPPVTLAPQRSEIDAHGIGAHVQLLAYVHRHAFAREGSVWIRAHARTLQRIRQAARVIPGITLVVELTPREATQTLPLEQLGSDAEAMLALAEEACRSAEQARAELLQPALAMGAAAWEIPFVRTSAEALDGATLRMRYAVIDGMPTLTWDDHPLLSLPVGRLRSGNARTLRDALEQYRDVGGIVLADPGVGWKTLEAREGVHEAWQLEPLGELVLVALLTDAAFWRMPTVAEARPHVAPAAEQRHLRLDPPEIERMLERSPRVHAARTVLVGHLLVGHAFGDAVHGLDEVPLFRRYDPRALAPATWVSLGALLRERPRPRVAVFGIVGRRREGVVVELTPAEARLLAEREAFEYAGPPVLVERDLPTSQRRHGRIVAPLAEVSVRVTGVSGMLRLESTDTRTPVSLWAKGLHVGDLQLPPPHAHVGGRLELGHDGVAPAAVDVERVVRDALVELRQTVVQHVLLAKPNSRISTRMREYLVHTKPVVAEHPREFSAAALRQMALGLPRQPRDAIRELLRVLLRRSVLIEWRWWTRTAVTVLDDTPHALAIACGRHPLFDESRALERRDGVFAAAILIRCELAAMAGDGASTGDGVTLASDVGLVLQLARHVRDAVAIE